MRAITASFFEVDLGTGQTIDEAFISTARLVIEKLMQSDTGETHDRRTGVEPDGSHVVRYRLPRKDVDDAYRWQLTSEDSLCASIM